MTKGFCGSFTELGVIICFPYVGKCEVYSSFQLNFFPNLEIEILFFRITITDSLSIYNYVKESNFSLSFFNFRSLYYGDDTEE